MSIHAGLGQSNEANANNGAPDWLGKRTLQPGLLGLGVWDLRVLGFGV